MCSHPQGGVPLHDVFGPAVVRLAFVQVTGRASWIEPDERYPCARCHVYSHSIKWAWCRQCHAPNDEYRWSANMRAAMRLSNDTPAALFLGQYFSVCPLCFQGLPHIT